MILILKNSLPALYSQDGKNPKDVKVPIKLFNPTGAATWYLTEHDPETDMAFGICDLGMGCPELGYVNVAELKTFRGSFNLGIERDRSWNKKTTLQDLMTKLGM